jgi:hypothetical protein
VLPILSLCHATRPPNEAVKSTEVGAGCFCKSTKVMMGGFCRRRVEAEAIQVWRHGPACLEGLRKVPAVGPGLAAGHDAVVEEVCRATRWVVAVVEIDWVLIHRKLVEEEVDSEVDPGMRGEVAVGFRTAAVEGEPIAAGRC